MSYPLTAVQAAAAVPGATFDHGWLCDELGGDLAPAFGGVTLVASGTGIVYGDDGPRGGSDGAIGFTAPRSAKFDGGAILNVGSNTDELVIAWVGKWNALPSAFGSLFGTANSTFTNGWSIGGGDGTSMQFALGPGSTFGAAIGGAFFVGQWHVGIAVIDRSGTDVARFGVRELFGSTSVLSASPTGINGNAASSASHFTVGAGDWVPANDNFRLTALYIGKGPGVASGLAANLASALASFAAYIAALSSAEQELLDFSTGALPGWVRSPDETLASAARSVAMARAHGDYLFSQSLITQATGPTADSPDWLDQHARDRGTSRQAGETDPVLQARLRVVPDAVTRQALLDAANAILAAAGVAGSAAMLEMPRDAAYLGSFTALTGTGGTFAQAGTVTRFTPTVLPWPTPPFQAAGTPMLSWQLVISGAASSGNNGTRAITGLDGDAAIVTNAGGVAGADPTVTWKAQRLDVTGNVTDGFHRIYLSRGYRLTQQRPFEIIVILPFGTSAGVQNSVRESLRLKKAAGYKLSVERRLNP